jgi:hypothetical protein
MDKEVREKKFLLAQSHSIRTRNKKRKKSKKHTHTNAARL